MAIKQSYFCIPESLIKRQFNEENKLPEYRTEFMRDRDRIMYATAFRRLSGKTQIYTVGNDDHKKNRLTHSLEVAQISRTIATALELDPDLAEAIALGHDFGHTPFGHAGERMLHDILIPNSMYIKESPFYKTSLRKVKREFKHTIQAHCINHLLGFKHNLQSVRVCTTLEDSYRDSSGKNIGLNLTNFTLYGMMLHSAPKYKDSATAPNFQSEFDKHIRLRNDTFAWSFEAYIVALADDIAQWHHDLEDALREGVLPLKKIAKTIEASLRDALGKSEKKTLSSIIEKGIESSSNDRKHIADLSHIVVNTLVSDLIEQSLSNFETIETTLNITGPISKDMFLDFDNQLKKAGLSFTHDNIISFSNRIKKEPFKKTIEASIHHSRNVERMNEKGKYIIRKLFEAYYAHPQQLPDGPILHLLVALDPEKYENIDVARKKGIGMARLDFEERMKNPDIYTKCLLMRRICDHIASMTDHYAIEEYNNLYG